MKPKKFLTQKKIDKLQALIDDNNGVVNHEDILPLLKGFKKKLLLHSVRSRFFNYDKRGVRAFIGYQAANGCWSVELYRKKTKEESEGDHDWKMVRIGHINSYNTRKEAELKALELCGEVCLEYGY